MLIGCWHCCKFHPTIKCTSVYRNMSKCMKKSFKNIIYFEFTCINLHSAEVQIKSYERLRWTFSAKRFSSIETISLTLSKFNHVPMTSQDPFYSDLIVKLPVNHLLHYLGAPFHTTSCMLLVRDSLSNFFQPINKEFIFCFPLDCRRWFLFLDWQ